MSMRSYRDTGALQINPLGSNTQNRSFLSLGALQPQKISGVTGTIAWTEAQDTWVVAGQTGVFGSVAWTETQDSWAISGSVRIDGSIAWTEAQDLWAISGTVSGGGVTGDAAWTESQDAWAIAGQTGVFASAAWTEVQDSWNVQGTLGVFGTVAWTETQDAWAISGSVSLPTVTGNAAWVEAQDAWNIQSLPVSTGGHFIPLTRKQEQALRKKQRKDREDQEAEWDKKTQEADAIAAEIRSKLLSSKTITEVINEVEVAEYDDEDESDLEMLLLA